MNPASQEPHALEGLCTCHRALEDVCRPANGWIRDYSLTCGLSSHRVRASARRVIDQETKEHRA